MEKKTKKHSKQQQSQMRTEVDTSACQTWSCSVILFEFRGLQADALYERACWDGTWRVRGYPWSDHKSAQLADSPNRSWNSPASHAGVKARAPEPRLGGPNGALWFCHLGERNHTVMDSLRKRHLDPAWFLEVTKSELINQPITRTQMIYRPPWPAESPEGAFNDALSLIFHTFCNMFTQLDCFIAAIEIRCD